jgi:hypothetical protein
VATKAAVDEHRPRALVGPLVRRLVAMARPRRGRAYGRGEHAGCSRRSRRSIISPGLRRPTADTIVAKIDI